MKMRELFSPIPKEIFRKDDVRERVEIFLVLLVVAGLGYKFVKGSIKDYLSLDDPDVALAVFANAAVAAAFLPAYLLACWVIRLSLSFIYENFYHKNNWLFVAEAEESNDGTVNVQMNLTHQELNAPPRPLMRPSQLRFSICPHMSKIYLFCITLCNIFAI